MKITNIKGSIAKPEVNKDHSKSGQSEVDQAAATDHVQAGYYLEGGKVMSAGAEVVIEDVVFMLNRMASIDTYCNSKRKHYLAQHQRVGMSNELSADLRLARFCAGIVGSTTEDGLNTLLKYG